MPVQDDFNRANAGDIATGVTWWTSYGLNRQSVLSNQCLQANYPESSGSFAQYGADGVSFSRQQSKLIFKGMRSGSNNNGSGGIGVRCRSAVSAASPQTDFTGYVVIYTRFNDGAADYLNLLKFVNADLTVLDSTPTTGRTSLAFISGTGNLLAADDALIIDAVASTIRMLRNTTVLASVTDTSIPAGGYPSIVTQRTFTADIRGTLWDDYERINTGAGFTGAQII